MEYRDTSTGVYRVADSFRTGEAVAISDVGIQLADAVNHVPVHRLSFNPALAATANTWVEIQQLHIMDWQPNLNLRRLADWSFMVDATFNDMNLCVREVCKR